MTNSSSSSSLSHQQLSKVLDDIQAGGKSLAQIAEELATDDTIRRRICEMANSPTRARKIRIDNPVHAASYIGGRRIANFIQQRLDEVQSTENSVTDQRDSVGDRT